MDITLALGLASWESFWSFFLAKAGTYKTKSKKDIPEPLFILIKQLPLILYTKFPINLKKNDRFIECGSGACNETAPCENAFFAKGSTYKKKSKNDRSKPLILHNISFPKILYTNFLIDHKKIERFIACRSDTGNGVENGVESCAEKFPTDCFN